jgi:hypothetical protein
MSAFPESGRSKRSKTAVFRGRFRPKAATLCRSRKRGKMAEESYSVVNSTKGRSTSLIEYAGCAFKAVIQ